MQSIRCLLQKKTTYYSIFNLIKMKRYSLFISLFASVLLFATCSKGPKPVAAFSFEPASALARDTVKFSNQSTDATTYSWNFGDDSTSTLEAPGHIYMAGGTFTVTLTATGLGGKKSASQTLTILPSISGGWTSTFTNGMRSVTGSLNLVQHISGSLTGTAQVINNAALTPLNTISNITGLAIVIETTSQGSKYAFKGTINEAYDMIQGSFFLDGVRRSDWYALKKRN